MAGILEDLTNLKSTEEKITNNKVANFAYTNKAYEDNDADGVETYSVNKDNNIPVSTPSIIQTNSNVLFKGFRTKSSSVARMLVNHFFGRVSYNLNKVNDNFQSLLEKLITSIGTANGLATLDSSGRIPSSQLPESAMEFKGTWDASTNTPTLADGTGTKGDMYIVSVAGTQDLGSGEISFFINDRVIYSGSVWTKLSGGAVEKVNGILADTTGNIAITGEDIHFSSTIDEDIPSTVEAKCNSVYRTWLSQFLSRAWIHSSQTSGYFMGGARYANGIWVACSYGYGSRDTGLYYSTDGKTWTQSSQTTGSFSGAHYANGVWVACNDNNYGLYYSTDGMTWTQSSQTSGYFNGGARYANGLWVACSNNGLYYSTDGKTWTQSSQTTGNFYGGARYANGLWVACGSNSTGLWYSTDGMNWTQSNITSSISYGARYANGVWVACSNNGLYYSTDGMTWTQSNITSEYCKSARYANGIWVACSKYSNGLYYSTDGKTWTQSSQTTGGFEGGARYANGIWVACASSSITTSLYYSTDGMTWTQSNITSEYFSGGARYANGLWVACSQSNTGLYYSSIDDLIESGDFSMVTD